MSESPALVVKGLTVRQRENRRLLVDGLSFQMQPGELVCLTGPSGSGKSTAALALMRLLPDALEVVAGTARLGDVDLLSLAETDLPRQRGKNIAFLPQDPLSGLNPVLACGPQVEEPLKLHTTWTRSHRREAVFDSFREMGLPEPGRIFQALPVALSGGQRQRVLLAMVTILGPRVLIADEPTTALDPDSAERVLDLLSRLRQRRGTAVLLITHDLDLVRAHASCIVAIDEGRMAANASLGAIRRSPSVHDARAQRGAPDAAEVLHVTNLSKAFRGTAALFRRPEEIPVLDRLSLVINRGEIVGIGGASGTGKTTLGRCVADLETRDDGEVIVNGRPTERWRFPGAPHPVQLVYQSPYSSLNPRMRVGEAVEEGLRSLRLPVGERTIKIRDTLIAVGLPPEYAARLPAELSGGERQRVVIARCLLATHSLLVADEPTASIDERTRDQILDLLRSIASDTGLSVLLISHDREALERVCDRVLFLDRGQLRPISARPSEPQGPCALTS